MIPDMELSDRVTAFRKKFLSGLNERDEHKKFPHITLQHTFGRPVEIEEEIDPGLQSMGKDFSPFEVSLSGIGHFDKRVIWLKVVDNPVLSELNIRIKKFLLEKMRFTADEVSSDYIPHITLEKKLRKEDFEKCWKIISDEKFEGSFTADSFSLMRHTGVKWNEIRRYVFQ